MSKSWFVFFAGRRSPGRHTVLRGGLSGRPQGRRLGRSNQSDGRVDQARAVAAHRCGTARAHQRQTEKGQSQYE